jgi:hypothetical protein
VIKNKTEKILKYKNLTLEIRRMWNVKVESDTGNNKGISKSFRQYLSNIPGKHKIIRTTKKALLCILHVLRIVLM